MGRSRIPTFYWPDYWDDGSLARRLQYRRRLVARGTAISPGQQYCYSLEAFSMDSHVSVSLESRRPESLIWQLRCRVCLIYLGKNINFRNFRKINFSSEGVVPSFCVQDIGEAGFCSFRDETRRKIVQQDRG